MAENQTGHLRCQAGCWAAGGAAGLIAAVMLPLLGGISVTGGIFLGILLAIGIAVFLSLVVCPKSQPMGGETISKTTAATVGQGNSGASGSGGSGSGSFSPRTEYGRSSSAKGASAAPTTGATAASAPGTSEAEAGPASDPTPQPAPGAAGASEADATPSGGLSPQESDKPETLSSARAGGPDDLKKIKGVGPKLEQQLHGMGFYHYDQIANWSDREVAWVDDNLEGFRGRVTRDDWVSQAKTLSQGGTP